MGILVGLLPSLTGAVSQGLLWGVMVLGVYITFRILNISDLTVDGSFALGACVTAVMILNFKVNPALALFVSLIAGGIAGLVTGMLIVCFDIPAILSGILTQISLWSINLIIMQKSNLPLLNSNTVFLSLGKIINLKSSGLSLVLGLVISIIIVVILYYFFGTELGSCIRATGNNEKMIRALGVDTGKMKILGLVISNAFVGLSGALVCQSQKYADINMGTGAIVIGLASIVIGEILFRRFISFVAKFTSVVVGCILYFIIRAVVLKLGMHPDHMKLFSAIIVALALVIPVMLRRYKENRDYKLSCSEV